MSNGHGKYRFHADGDPAGRHVASGLAADGVEAWALRHGTDGEVRHYGRYTVIVGHVIGGRYEPYEPPAPRTPRRP